MDRRVRLRSRSRSRSHRHDRRRRIPGRLRRAQTRVRGLSMPKIVKSTIIDAPTDRVWEVLRDFNGHDQWHPAVATSAIERGQPSDKIGCVGGSSWPMAPSCASNCSRCPISNRASAIVCLDTPIPMFNYVAHVQLLPVTDGGPHILALGVSFHDPSWRRTEADRNGGRADLSGRLRCRPQTSERGRMNTRVSSCR